MYAFLGRMKSVGAVGDACMARHCTCDKNTVKYHQCPLQRLKKFPVTSGLPTAGFKLAAIDCRETLECKVLAPM